MSCSKKEVIDVASVNWMKATKQKAGGLKKHLGKKERVELNHSNTHINKELSHLNYSIGCSDYNEALHSMNERTKEVDAVLPPKRIRKDRVTCCFLEVPCPRKITEQGRSDEFFRNIHELYRKFFGEENVHGTMVHKDEVHEYIDAHKKVKTMSLEHAHTLVSSFTPSKGINGKAFETKARLNALNKAVNAMCIQCFGISFNTGEKANNEQLEVLKTKSAEVKRQQVENQVVQLQNQVVQLQNQALSFNPPPKKMLESQSVYNDRVATHQQAIAVSQRQVALDQWERRLRQREKEIAEAEKIIADTVALERENSRLKQELEDYKALPHQLYKLKNNNDILKSQNQNLVRENNLLKSYVEDYNYTLTGQAKTADEIIYPQQKQQHNPDFGLTM